VHLIARLVILPQSAGAPDAMITSSSMVTQVPTSINVLVVVMTLMVNLKRLQIVVLKLALTAHQIAKLAPAPQLLNALLVIPVTLEMAIHASPIKHVEIKEHSTLKTVFVPLAQLIVQHVPQLLFAHLAILTLF